MDLVGTGLLVCSVIKLTALYVISRRKKERRRVGLVAGLRLYPLKSVGGGLDVQEAQCTSLGLRDGAFRDRHWMVTDSEYKAVFQPLEPPLTLIRVACDEENLVLSAPGQDALRLPVNPEMTEKNEVTCSIHGEPIKAIDCGPDAAEWIQKVVGKPDFRIVYAAEHLRKRIVAESHDDRVRDSEPSGEIAFASNSPYLLLNETSLADLNKRLSQPVSIHNFRGNIIVSTEEPFEEDTWVEVDINGVQLKWVKFCDRCVQTTIDPMTGRMDKKYQPLVTLNKYRKKPGIKTGCFGITMCLEKEGPVKVGDPVYAVPR